MGLLDFIPRKPGGLLGALMDEKFRSDVVGGLLDSANRGAVAGTLGAPVDLMSLAMRPFGYAKEQPVGGSEWIGQKMQNAGLVSGNRNHAAEALASVAIPMGAARAAPAVFAAEQNMLQNSSMMGPRTGSPLAQRGAIGLDLDGQIKEILDGIRGVPSGERVGLRILPSDVPTPSIGDKLAPSTKWVDGNKTDKALYGASSMDISKRNAEEVRAAINRLGLFSEHSYYPGNKLAIISGASKRRGEDAGEALIRDATVRYLTDPPLGPR